MQIKELSLKSYAIIGLIVVTVIVVPLYSVIVAILVLLISEKRIIQTVSIGAILIVVSMVAFHTVPLEFDDLFRHYGCINDIILYEVPFLEMVNWGYPGVYVNNFIFFLVAQTTITELYAAILVPCIYGIFLVMFTVTNNEIKIPYNYRVLIFIFLLFAMTPRSAFSGVRNHLAYFCLAFFCWLIFVYDKNKPMAYFWMGLACVVLYFFHLATIVIVVIFCCFLVYEKLNRRLRIIVSAVLLLSMTGLYIICSMMDSYLVQFSNIALIKKVLVYATEFFEFPNINHYLLKVGVLVSFAIVISFVRYQESPSKFIRYNHFYFFFVLFSIGSIPNSDVLTRNIYFLTIMSIPVFYQFIARYKQNRKIMLGFYIICSCFFIAQVIFTWRSLVSYPWQFDITLSNLSFMIFN